MQDEGIQTAPRKRDIMLQAQTEPEYAPVVGKTCLSELLEDVPHAVTTGTSMEYNIGDLHKELELGTQTIKNSNPSNSEIQESKLLEWLTTNFTNLLNNTIKQKEEEKEKEPKAATEELIHNLREELISTMKAILTEKEEQQKKLLESTVKKKQEKIEEDDDFLDENDLNELLDEEPKLKKSNKNQPQLEQPKKETRDTFTRKFKHSISLNLENDPPKAQDTSVQVNPPPINMAIQVDQLIDTSVQVENFSEKKLENENNTLKELLETFLKREQERAVTSSTQPVPAIETTTTAAKDEKEDSHDSFDDIEQFLDDVPDERLKTANSLPPLKQTAEIAIQVEEEKPQVILPKEEESSVLEDEDSYETSSVSSEGEKEPNKLGLFSDGEVMILPNLQTQTRQAYRLDYLQRRVKAALQQKDPFELSKNPNEIESDESLDYQRMKYEDKRSDVSEGELMLPVAIKSDHYVPAYFRGAKFK